jgi:RHS repeat-associated protein
MPIRVRCCYLRSVLLILLGSTFLFSFGGLRASGQSVPGIQMFSTVENGVDLATGNIIIDNLVLRTKTGKVPFWSKVSGTSGMSAISDGLNYTWYPLLLPIGSNPAYGWSYQDPASLRFTNSSGHETMCTVGSKTYYGFLITSPGVIDSSGALHTFVDAQWLSGNGPAGSDCQPSQGTLGPVFPNDGSGYTMIIVNGNPTVYDKSGNYINGVCSLNTCSLQATIYDPDGATISDSGGSVTDSLNTTALTISGTPLSSPVQYSYKDVNNNSQIYSFAYTKQPLATNFGCPTLDQSAISVPMLTSILTPGGGQYVISYEGTYKQSKNYTDRIATITLPSGGSISYNYSGGNQGLNCNTATVPTLEVTVNDNNGNVGLYKYASSLNTTPGTNGGTTGLGVNFTVTKTDPALNQTVYTFSGEFQTEKQVYQGSASGTPLVTTITCYNGFANGQNSSSAACTSPSTVPTLPITQTDVYTYLGSSTSPSLVETKFDSYGDVTAVKRYGFGALYPPAGTPVSETDTSYANVAGVTCGTVSTYIYNRPCSVTTYSSGSVVQQASYTYNGAGHPTQTSTLVNGSTYLTSTATYNSSGGSNGASGTIASFTDVNSAITTYNYNGTDGCNGMLPTSVSVSGAGLPSGGLTTSTEWNCNGGVEIHTTDANGQPTAYGYVNQSGTADPYWRNLSVTDPLQNTTWTIYSKGTTLPVTIETVLANSSASSADTLATYDGLARPILKQTKQAPSSTNFDTVATVYDLLGRVASVGMPCVSTASLSCSPNPTTTTYDALNRPLLVTDGGGGTTNYSYAPAGSQNNDVLVTVGPAPAGEKAKNKQLEYDGLGRLTSVCELTGTANGGGSCAQNAPQTGYWTNYTYDGLNRLLTVSQNAQSSYPQGRTYSYDGLNRLTSESNPESGITYYTYDTDTTCGIYKGDLVKRVDAANNVSCYAYDGMHRKTGASYPSGPYASATPTKTFVYDTTSFTCATPPNNLYPTGAYVVGRLAEAYTGSSTAKTTDIAYCYSPRGEISDVFESTPNSGGYFHTTAYYLPTGGLSTLGGVPGLNGWTFAPDGEGRPYSATYGTSKNWVTAATYYPSNTVSSPPACSPCNTVAFGSGDADTYGVAATTGRMNSFQFKVGATPTTVAGTPGWNADGTLGSLAISDPFNSSNTQNCSYVYDDLARVQSVNCVNGSTTIWNQSFSLDAFGNISKSGSSSFAATYVLANGTTNNQEQLVGSCVPKYDANGNLTKDCSFTVPPTYAWDADGNPVGLHAVTLTFDALDREVEFNTGSSIRQILYSPIGKLGLANGQTAETTRIPLPGGSTAQMTGTGGTTYILHSDWLGSSKLTSNYSSRAITYDTAFAPYGEDYASSGNSPSNLDFTGQFEDTLAGLYDFLNREYDPVQGRWISPDPSGLNSVDPTNPQSWNRYAYALNNPLSNIDPTGLECVWDDGSFDSADDPDTGSASKCGAAGGTWYDPADFAKRGLGDWSPNANPQLAAELGQQGGYTFQTQGTAQADTTLACAVQFGSNHSIAAAFGLQNNFVANLFGGNTVSSLVNLGLFVSGDKTPTSAQLASISLKGMAQGIPVPPGNPGLSGATGQLRSLAVQSAVASAYNAFAGVGQETIELGITATGTVATPAVQLGTQTLTNVATGIGLAKFALDLGTFAYGYAFVCH